MDLGSTSGTFINDQPVEAGVPTKLSDRDRLRLGNVAFTILINTQEPVAKSKKTSAGQVEVISEEEDSSGSDPILPMHEQDVANWLTELDESDRQVRIEKLRARANSRDEKESLLDEAFDTIPETNDTPEPELENKPPDRPTGLSNKSPSVTLSSRINQTIQFVNDHPQVVLLFVMGGILILILGWSIYGFFVPDPTRVVVPGI